MTTSDGHDLDHPSAWGAAARPGAAAGGPSGLALAVAGSAAVATAFGMARYGYGLLLPDVKGDLVLGATVLGAIGTLAYVGYLIATSAVPWLIRRVGQRATVVAGGGCAVAGTVVIALANGPAALGAGVTVAGASCGLVYPPFGDAVAGLPDRVRARTLATINCGTGWGVAVAAPIAIAFGDRWRLAWLGFAACAVLSTVAAARVLPARTDAPDATRPGDAAGSGAGDARAAAPDDAAGSHVGDARAAVPGGAADSRLMRPRRLRAGVGALLLAAFLVGLGSAGYWTYAVDAARDGGLSATAARVTLGVAGVASLLGLVAADVMRAVGARRTYVGCALLEAAAIALLALTPGSLLAAIVAAVAFGAGYNALVAVIVMWGTALYPERPSSGLALALVGNTVGLLAGPLAGGVLTDAVGFGPALLGAAAVVASAVAVGRRVVVP